MIVSEEHRIVRDIQLIRGLTYTQNLAQQLDQLDRSSAKRTLVLVLPVRVF